MYYNIGDTVLVKVTDDVYFDTLHNNATRPHKIVEFYIFCIHRNNSPAAHHYGCTKDTSIRHDFIFSQGDINVVKQNKNYQIGSDIDTYLGAKGRGFNLNQIVSKKDNNIIITTPNISNELDGAFCINCKEFAPYQTSGFTCFQCKEDRFRFKF